MNMIDILIYAGLATAALLAVLYGLPYVLVALLAIGAIHSYPSSNSGSAGPPRPRTFHLPSDALWLRPILICWTC